MNKEAVFNAAIEAHERGICVVPPAQDGTKRPDGPWAKRQKQRPSRSEIDRMYTNGRTGIGFVCGRVSDGGATGVGLEAFDVDDRSTYAEVKKTAKAAGLGGLFERIESGYLENSPNGAHLLYFCEEIGGNTKLAKKPTGDKQYKTLIETRGEGGYLIVAPTFGGVNPTGSYELVRGGIATIATISPKERKQLHDLARVFDESTRPQENLLRHPDYPGNGTARPGDEYADRVSWEDILEPAGWTHVYRRLGVDAWRRPGKERGISATTNYNASDLLYVFSTSTVFDSERGVNKFAAYAILNHDGDFRAAARELRLLGFGGQEPVVEPEVDISGILAQVPDKEEQAQHEFPPELLRVPGMVGELAEYINATSSKPQPVLALGASIAAVATAIGRKVRTETNLRSNIYVLGAAETGAGKERPRQAIRAVFEASGLGHRAAYDEMSSDAAIISAVNNTPSCLFLLDEIGRTLKAIAHDKAPSYLANAVSVYLKLYGTADGTFYGKTYADMSKWVVVEQPNLCIYGTTVPSRLYESITSDQVLDGFLSRLLVFESRDPDPEYIDVYDNGPSESLVEQFSRWEKRPENENTAAGNIEKVIRPGPRIVAATTKARSVFSDLESDMAKVRAEIRGRGDDPGMYTRVAASARKLALIRACGIAFDEPEITESDATWGSKLAVHLFDSMGRRVAANVSDNATEAMHKKVADVIRKSPRKEISRSKLTDKTWWLKRPERTDILATLEESGRVQKFTKKSKTKPAVYYRWKGD